MYEDLIRELRNPYNTIAVDVAERQVYVHQVPLGKTWTGKEGRHMIDWMLAARIDPLGAVIALSVALGLVLGIEMGRRCK